MNYKTNVLLKDYTTLKIGGPAARFFEPSSIEELQEILVLHHQNAWPLVVLGNGSNMLFEDGGYDGSVIHIGPSLSGAKILEDNDTQVKVYAGEENSALAQFLASEGLKGFEFASGIPGTIGGAVIMNAGAYNGEIKDILVKVGYLDEKGNLHEVEAKDLDLGYRHSWFSDHFGVVVYAILQLEKANPKEIQDKILDLHNKRYSKQPMDKASAGSTFKRPSKGYASALIQQCGLKGKRVGDAMVSTKHTGFLINDGKATCTDFLELVHQVQEEVRNQTGIDLELEIRFIPKSLEPFSDLI